MSIWPAAAARAAGETGVGIELPQLPLRFEENLGQTDPQVRFLARAADYTLYLTDGGAVFAPRTGETPLHIGVVGGAASEPPRGLDRLEGLSHYLLGSPTSWTTHVPAHARVAYSDILPGIDLVFRGHGQLVEFDFVVSPGADPGAISLEFSGAESISLTEAGDLVLATASGELRLHAPVVHQRQADGVLTRVGGRYRVLGKGASAKLAFELAPHDASHALVIDPVVSYASYLGGTDGSTVIFDLDVDPDGHAYLTGYTSATTFPTANAQQAGLSGAEDVFVTKLSPDGSSLVFSTYLGGSAQDGREGAAVAVGSDATVYLAGTTSGGTFPTSVGAFETAPQGVNDCFAARLSADGSTLLFSTILGGSSTDKCRGVAVDASGNAYVTGWSQSSDYPTTFGAFDTAVSASDAVVTKVAASGATLAYSTFFGGTSNDEAFDVEVDGDEAVIVGTTSSSNLPVLAAFQGTIGGSADGFIARFDASGAGLVHASFVGGTAVDRGFGLGLAADGTAFATGVTSSDDFPATQGAYQTARAAFADAWVVAVSDSGSQIYGSYLGGASDDRGLDVAVDDGRAIVGGQTASANFPTVDPVQATKSTSSDAFVTIFASNGASLVFSTFLGGIGIENQSDFVGVAGDGNGSAFIAGETSSPDFPTTAGAFQETDPVGGGASYVARIVFEAAAVPALAPLGLLVLAASVVAAVFAASRAR